MTAPASSVPVVRQWLYQQCTTAAAGFTEPTVEVYLSQEDHASTQDLIVIGGAHRRFEPNRLVGGGGVLWGDETYTVDVDIACYVAGPDAFNDTATQDSVDTRAYKILAAVETQIRLDPSAGGAVVVLHPAGSSSQHEWDEESNGGHCQITLTVQVTATQ